MGSTNIKAIYWDHGVVPFKNTNVIYIVSSVYSRGEGSIKAFSWDLPVVYFEMQIATLGICNECTSAEWILFKITYALSAERKLFILNRTEMLRSKWFVCVAMEEYSELFSKE